MIPQGGGKIANIGSNLGEIAFKSRSVCAVAKAGVHHMSRALSHEWGKDKRPIITPRPKAEDSPHVAI